MSTPGHLTDVHLQGIRFARNEDWSWEAITYAVDGDTTGEIEADRTGVVARLHAEIKWHRPDDAAAEQIEGPFELVLDVVGRFAWDQPERTDEDILGWVEFNSQHLLWPYLRSYVASITAASGLPVLTLFTVSVPNPGSGSDLELGIEPSPSQLGS